MQQAGFSVSREVLLAIRQGNQQRVEHLVEGLVVALRRQRGCAERANGGEGSAGYQVQASEDAPLLAPRSSSTAGSEEGDPVDAQLQAPGEAGGTPGGVWGSSLNLGTSVEQFAFAVQRLSRMHLGQQHEPFWEEVSSFVELAAGELSAKELALLCNAYAAGAPRRLAGPLGASLLGRAAAVADELSPKDFVMVMHGLASGLGSPGVGAPPAVGARSPGAAASSCTDKVSTAVAVRQLAWAARKVRLDEGRPQQAALLLNAFVRLQHAHDAPLFGRWFGFACKTLPAWDAQALALLCSAFAVGWRAQARTSERGWQAVAARCAAVVGGANGQDVATLAHTLQRIWVPPATVAEFYDRLEQLLCERPRINDFLSSRQLAMVAHGLARHRRPDNSAAAGQLLPEGSAAPLAPAGEAGVSSSASPPSLVSEAEDEPPPSPGTTWPFEEFAARRMKDFREQDLVFLLEASVRLQRGGLSLFKAIATRLRSLEGKLSSVALAKICSSAVKAAPLVGVSESVNLLSALRKECIRLTPQLTSREVPLVIAAYDLGAAALARDRGSRLRIWKNREQARTALDSILTRADEVSPSAEWLESVHCQVRRIMEAERLLVTPAPHNRRSHQNSAADAGSVE